MSPVSLRLLETMRWDGPAGGVALLDRHLARLAASAAFFGFSLEEKRLLDDLDIATKGLTPEPHRLRLRLGRTGEVDLSAVPLRALEELEPLRRPRLHPEPVEVGGPFWQHKTTHRPHYEVPFRQARAEGFDEAILLDRDGHVVEGTRTTVWIARGGRLLTPPRSAGGLPGVMRAHLLATRPDAEEAPVARADLFRADAVLLSNAVRGLLEVEVERQGPTRGFARS